MSISKKTIIILSVCLSLLLVVGAIVAAQVMEPARKPPVVVAQHPVSKKELARADGKDARDCYVAVDGTVYQIKDFSLWQDGKHKTSKNQAYCGADMSEVINKSPHGRKILDLLIKIGPLQA